MPPDALPNPLTIEIEDGCGDTLECVNYGEGVTLSIDSPWTGSSETGFGYTLDARLTPAQVALLIKWLKAYGA